MATLATDDSSIGLWTIGDAARYLAVSERWVERARNKGDFPPAMRLGRLVRFHPAEIIAWAASAREAA